MNIRIIAVITLLHFVLLTITTAKTLKKKENAKENVKKSISPSRFTAKGCKNEHGYPLRAGMEFRLTLNHRCFECECKALGSELYSVCKEAVFCPKLTGCTNLFKPPGKCCNICRDTSKNEGFRPEFPSIEEFMKLFG